MVGESAIFAGRRRLPPGAVPGGRPGTSGARRGRARASACRPRKVA